MKIKNRKLLLTGALTLSAVLGVRLMQDRNAPDTAENPTAAAPANPSHRIDVQKLAKSTAPSGVASNGPSSPFDIRHSTFDIPPSTAAIAQGDKSVAPPPAPRPLSPDSSLPPAPLSPLPAPSSPPHAPYARLLASAELLDTTRSPLPDGRTLERSLYDTDEVYPLIVFERVLSKGPDGEVIDHEKAMVGDHIIVTSNLSDEEFAALNRRHGAEVRRQIPNQNTWLVSFPNPTPDTVAAAVVEYARALGPDGIAAPDHVVYTTATPNDSGFGNLWGMNQANDHDIDAPEAWNYHTGDASVKVMVIDTGVDYAHADLAANMWINPGEIPGNSVDDDGNGYVDDIYGYDFYNWDNNPADDHGHGTHCAGTIAGVGNNGIGVAGVCWTARIIAGKFIGASGYGYDSGAMAAVYYGTAKGIALSSNSWGGGGFNSSLKASIDAANAAGILFVAAAGNSFSNNDAAPFYPCGYDSANIIAVTATTNTGAQYYNYGATTVDIGAPGTSIYSTYPGGGYANMSGTSMATPHVAGACALVKAARPDYTGAQLRTTILNSAEPLASLAGKCVTGGRVNVRLAMEMAGIPTYPTGLSATAIGATQVSLAWGDTAANETGYVVQRLVGIEGVTMEVSGNNNHATLMPSVSSGPAHQSGGYYQFDGSNDYIASVDNPADATGDVTVALWMNATTATANQVLASKYNSSEDAGWLLLALSNGKVRVDGRAKAATYYSSPESTTSVRDGLWHHVAFVRTGSTWKLFVDGVLQSSSTRTAGPFSNSTTLEIGKLTTNTLYYSGAMDAFRLYTRACSDAEVLSLFQAGRSAAVDAISSSSQMIFHPMDIAPTDWSQVAALPANSGTHADSSVTGNTPYSYRVRAANASGNSAWSNVVLATTPASGTPPPTAPSALAVTSTSSSQVDLSWTDNASTETGFELQRKTGLDGTLPGQVEDYSGNASHGTLMPALATGPALQSGGYYQFDGSNDYIASVDNPADATGDITVALWMNAATATANQVLASKYNSSEDAGWLLLALSNGKVRVDGRAKAATYYSSPESTTSVRDGLWHHVAFVRTGSTWKLFVDGILQSSSTRTAGPFSNSTTLEIGKLTTNTLYYSGAMDAFRLYTRACSDAEVLSLFQAGRSAAVDAISSSSQKIFHPMDAAPTDWTQVALPAANSTSHSDATVLAGTPYSYRVRAANASGNSAWANVVLATTPASGTPPPTAPSALAVTSATSTQVNLSWTDNASTETGFELQRKTGQDGTTSAEVEDYSGNASHGTLMPTSATGPAHQSGGYYQFDGSNDYIASVDNPADATGDVTVALWMNATTATANQVLASKYNSSEDAGWLLLALSNGKVRVDGRAKAATYYSSPESTTSVRDGLWHHVAFVRTGSTWKLFVDGVLQSSSTRTAGPFSNSTTLEIGKLTTNTLYYSGAMDAFRLYTRACSDAEVLSLFQAGRSAAVDAISSSSQMIFHPMDIAPTDWSQVAALPANSGTHADSSVTGNTPYSYRVRAANASGNSAWSNVVLATTPASGTPPPTAPSALAVTSTSSSQVDLSWTDNASTETGFELQRKTGLDGTLPGQVEDYSGNASHGTLMPALATGPALQSGGYYQFDGSNDYIASVDNPADATGDITVALWMNAATATANQVLASKYNSSEDAGWLLLALSNGKVRVDGRAKAATYYSSPESTTSVRDGLWHHVAFVRTGSTWKLFVDGILQSSSTRTAGPFSNSTTLEIGKLTTNTLYYSGAMDAFRLYTRACSDAEVLSLFQAGRSAAVDAISSSSQKIFHPMDAAPTDWTQVALPAANSTSHSDATVLAGTPYSYRVRAANASGNSAWSNIASTRTSVSGMDGELGAGSGELGSEVGGQRSEVGNTGTDTGIRLTLSWAEPVVPAEGAHSLTLDSPPSLTSDLRPLTSAAPAPLLSWTSREGATYAIEFTPSLDQVFGLLHDGIPATPPVNTFRLPADTPEGFFRIVER